jgi:hypothetical protein
MLKCEVNITMLTQGGFVYKTIFPEADRIYIYPRNYYGMVVVPVSYSNNTIIWTRYSISRPKKRESSPGGMTAGMPPGRDDRRHAPISAKLFKAIAMAEST